MDITVGMILEDLSYCKELLFLVRRNRKKPNIVLNGLLHLFEDTACVSSCFPKSDKIVEYLCGLQCEGKSLPEEELDFLLISINAAIKDTERQLKGLNYNQILFESED